jgi:hypothetical protein
MQRIQYRGTGATSGEANASLYTSCSVQALLEFSGGRVKVQQHGFIKEYTTSENANLYTLVFNITRLRQFRDFNLKEICKTLLKSIAFSRMTISI